MNYSIYILSIIKKYFYRCTKSNDVYWSTTQSALVLSHFKLIIKYNYIEIFCEKNYRKKSQSAWTESEIKKRKQTNKDVNITTRGDKQKQQIKTVMFFVMKVTAKMCMQKFQGGKYEYNWSFVYE